MPEVFDYVMEMDRAAAAVRRTAIRESANMPPELARAIVLCAPYVRYPTTGDEELTLRLRLDYLAGMEYGGYHGFSSEQIRDECELIEVLAENV